MLLRNFILKIILTTVLLMILALFSL